MEEVLKGLEGKSLTKKKLFDFLADINLDSLKIPVLHKVEKMCYVESQLHCSNHIQQNKITIYEEIK